MNILKVCGYALCGYLGVFYNQYNNLMDLLLLLWALDNITGVLKYYRLGRLTSKGLWYGTIVKTLLLSIPFLVARAASAFGFSGEKILAFVFAILCFAEAISNLQNLKVARTGIEETEQDVITKLLDGILILGNKVFEYTLAKLQKASDNVLEKKIDEILKPK